MDGGTLQPYSVVSPKDNRERKIFLAGKASSSRVGHLLCLKEAAPVMGILKEKPGRLETGRSGVEVCGQT